MIQRIQTIWMILAILALALTFQFPFYSGSLLANNTYDTVMVTDNIYLMILTTALATVILVNIFLFKQRSIQFKINLVCILMECFIIFMYTRETNLFSQGNFSLWAGLHLLIIVFLFLAAKGIYHDSKLIKESNRLR